MALRSPRRRARRGSLERPVSTRIYRAAWVLAIVPLLVAAFSVGAPRPLPGPALPPTFDRTTAVQFATELARQFPDRSAGSQGAGDSADWVAERLGDYGIATERQTFSAEVPGLGRKRFENVVAVVRGRSPQTIVVMAHRDNLGRSPGANDNASGTAALIELARTMASAGSTGGGRAALAHTLVFLSSDGGAYGGLGAAQFAREPRFAEHVLAVVNFDSIGGRDRARLEFGADAPRSPASALLATAAESVRRQTGAAPGLPGPVAQVVDLAFPFSLYEQAPFVAYGTPAVTLTTADDRPPPVYGDTLSALDHERLGELGRSGQDLVASLDHAAEVAGGTDSYVYLAGSSKSVVRGWTIQFVLLVALLPFLAATLDLFARCRRRRIALAPALRSYASRLGVWLWAGGLFAFFTVAGILPDGAARPLSPDLEVAGDWPVAALIALCGLSAIAWLAARPRLVPMREVDRSEELGGHLAAMLVLAVVALVVAAVNPYALLFVLPSLHAWLWLPHAESVDRRLALYAVGFAGPLALLASFAWRFGLGLDAPWYLLALLVVGYVPVPLGLAFLAWAAAAAQVGALAVGRYAPYPAREERPVRGPIRETIRQLVLLSRRARRPRAAPSEPPENARALEE